MLAVFRGRRIQRWRRRPFSGGGGFFAGGSGLFRGMRIQRRRLWGSTFWFIWRWGRLRRGIEVGAINVGGLGGVSAHLVCFVIFLFTALMEDTGVGERSRLGGGCNVN